MRATINDQLFNQPTSASCKDESPDFVDTLQELLVQSINLRDMYKNARWQTADIEFRRLRQLYDGHYQDQIQLVDILIDRLRILSGAGRVFAGDFIRGTQFSKLFGVRPSALSLLVSLVNAHESVLNMALPLLANDGQVQHSWTADRALGRVVLTNDLQLFAVREAWINQRRTLRSQPSSDC